MRTITFIAGATLALAAGRPGAVFAQTAAACLAEPVVLKRFGLPEPQLVSLTDCEQRPNPEALPLVSALAAPPASKRDGDASAASGEQADPAQPAAEAPVQLLEPQLLVRLQQIASRFPDRAIEIVSGLRTRARATSRHLTGHALDVRVEGVDNEELSIFARTLEQTGVGYYPNSTFVHIDVREASAYWVDRSAPGERPDYVREPEGALAPPDPVLAGTPADAERDILSAQLARALLDVHGPELPVYEQSDATEPVEAAEAVTGEPPHANAQPAQADAQPAETDAQPAQAAAPQPGGGAAPQPDGEEHADPAQLDAEIQGLLERALVVMREADAAG